MRESLDIIGRENELTELMAHFESAREGAGSVILLSGEAGVGVTALAETTLARSGFEILQGRAREEGTAAYGPLAAALRDCARNNPEVIEECGPLASHLALILPELGASPANATPETLVEAIAGALSAKARAKPTALFLDDLQWADNATLELLSILDERLRSERIVILVAYRSDEIPRGHPMRRLRNSLRRARRLREVQLAPLDRANTRVLIAHSLGQAPSESLVQLVYNLTQGLPLYLEELCAVLKTGNRVRAGKDGLELTPGVSLPIPDTVRETVLLRVDALSEPARNLIEVASVIGTELDLEQVCRLAGSDDGIDELTNRGILAESGHGRAAFRHAFVREVVRESIAWPLRRALHRIVATELEVSDEPPEVVAEHWLAAREYAGARRALLESAERSRRLHAYRDAARSFHRALEVWPAGEDDAKRLGTLDRLAHCAQLSGQLDDAAAALVAITNHPLTEADPVRRAKTLRSLATVYQLKGAWEDTLETRREAARAFEAARQNGEAAVEWLTLAGRYTAALNYDAALETVRTAATLAEGAQRWDAMARSLGLEGNLLAMQGDVERGQKLVHKGLSLALEHTLSEAASEVYRRLGSVLEFSSDYTGARDAYFEAVDYCRAQGIAAAAQTCLGCVAYIVYRTGEWKRTLEVCREILDKEEHPGTRAIADGVEGLVRAQRGETKQARRLLQRALEVSRRFSLTAMEMTCLYALAVVGENDADTEATRRYYTQLIDRWGTTEERHDVIPWLSWASSFFSSQGSESETTRCAEELASIASLTGNPEAVGALAHALGETAMLHGKPGEAAEQFQRAVERFEQLNVPLEQALSRQRAGVALAVAGSRTEAASHLTNAYRIVRNLGARPMAERIAADLESLGEKIEEGRHPEPTGVKTRGGLTRRQVEIARLLALGLTNKEIAGRLYLSARTVDMHVSNILDRLDCRSRTEAVRKANELGLLD